MHSRAILRQGSPLAGSTAGCRQKEVGKGQGHVSRAWSLPYDAQTLFPVLEKKNFSQVSDSSGKEEECS